jgi:hypothetical protein
VLLNIWIRGGVRPSAIKLSQLKKVLPGRSAGFQPGSTSRIEVQATSLVVLTYRELPIRSSPITPSFLDFTRFAEWNSAIQQVGKPALRFVARTLCAGHQRYFSPNAPALVAPSEKMAFNL